MVFLEGYWLQVWQWGQPYAAERTLDDAIALCQQYRLSGISVKAFDGRSWQANYDQSPDAVWSYMQISEQRRRCEQAGLGYAVWVNPLYPEDQSGTSLPLDEARPYLQMEGSLYAAAGVAAGMLWVDAEPYPQFWTAWRPPGAAWELMDRIRAEAPDVPIVWQPDPRPDRLAELQPDEWLPHSNVYAPQVYWPDFGEPWETTLQYARGQSGLAMATEYAPTLPGNADASDLEAALRWLRSRDVHGAIVWRMGTTGPEQLAVLRDNPLVQRDPCAELRQTVRGLAADLLAARRARRWRPVHAVEDRLRAAAE